MNAKNCPAGCKSEPKCFKFCFGNKIPLFFFVSIMLLFFFPVIQLVLSF